jgi:hypothetical protein
VEGTLPARRPRLDVRVWPVAVAVAIALPLGLLVYFLVPPASDVRLDDRVQHFTITTNVALLSAVISLLAARAAVEARHIPTLLTALGFMSLAGIFVVHGLATPGVLLVGQTEEIAASVVVALSAQLSLLVPAVLFAARHTPMVGWLERSRALTPQRLIAVFALGILAYGVMGLRAPQQMSSMVETMTGYGTTSGGYGGDGGTAGTAARTRSSARGSWSSEAAPSPCSSSPRSGRRATSPAAVSRATGRSSSRSCC